jgi:hypothetical protein
MRFAEPRTLLGMLESVFEGADRAPGASQQTIKRVIFKTRAVSRNDSSACARFSWGTREFVNLFTETTRI